MASDWTAKSEQATDKFRRHVFVGVGPDLTTARKQAWDQAKADEQSESTDTVVATLNTVRELTTRQAYVYEYSASDHVGDHSVSDHADDPNGADLVLVMHATYVYRDKPENH